MPLCATLIAAAITTAALAMADYWYTVWHNPDNTWQICNFRGDGQCHSPQPQPWRTSGVRGPSGHTV